jgi:hypothetical protein
MLTIKADFAVACCSLPSNASTAYDRHKCAPLLEVFVSIAATDKVALQSMRQAQRRPKKGCLKMKWESLKTRKEGDKNLAYEAKCGHSAQLGAESAEKEEGAFVSSAEGNARDAWRSQRKKQTCDYICTRREACACARSNIVGRVLSLKSVTIWMRRNEGKGGRRNQKAANMGR